MATTSFSDRSLVIFDLDGTLVDSLPGIVSCLRKTLDPRGVSYTEEQLLAFVGTPLADIFSSFDLDSAEVASCVDDYRQIYTTVGFTDSVVFPGVVELLTSLKTNGRSLALATVKLESAGEQMLGHHGLGKFFDAVVGAELNERNHKPELIAEALLRSGASPATAVMIGDRDLDILGAKACGVASIAASWGYAVDNELVDAGPDALASSPDELSVLLVG